MPNTHLETHCNVMLNSINIFKNGALLACFKDDGTVSPAEKKFLKKVNKQLDDLAKTLKNAP